MNGLIIEPDSRLERDDFGLSTRCGSGLQSAGILVRVNGQFVTDVSEPIRFETSDTYYSQTLHTITEDQ
jgi:hypothetical protein